MRDPELRFWLGHTYVSPGSRHEEDERVRCTIIALRAWNEARQHITERGKPDGATFGIIANMTCLWQLEAAGKLLELPTEVVRYLFDAWAEELEYETSLAWRIREVIRAQKITYPINPNNLEMTL